MPSTTAVETRELSPAECVARLRTVVTGHLAVSERAMPAVVPVHLEFVDEEVAIESCLGCALRLTAGIVALEAGTIDVGAPGEWAVEIRGHLRRSPSLRPRLLARRNARRSEAFRLSVDYVTGWEIESAAASVGVDGGDGDATIADEADRSS